MIVDGWNIHKNEATCKYCHDIIDTPSIYTIVKKLEEHQKICRINPR